MKKADAMLRLSRAVMETMEQRKLLAFSPAGTPTLVDEGGVVGVSSAAGLADGRHVVAWIDGNDAYVRLYNGDNTPVAAAQKVNVGGVATNVDVAINDSGSFVVVWESDDADGQGIFFRRYTGSGVPAGAPKPANSNTIADQTKPRVGLASDGSFVAVWESTEFGDPRIFGQAFNSLDEGFLGVGDIQYAGTDTTAPDISVNASGNYVIAYNTATSTVAQRFEADHDGLGALITVDNATDSQPAIGIASDNSFVVAWSVGAGPGGRDVLFQRYNVSGATVGGQVVAASNAAGDEQFPQVDVAASGKFVVGWAEASATPGTFDLVGFRAFTSAGASLGDDTIIPAVGFAGDTRFGIFWRDGQPVSVAYQSDGDALVQEYASQLVVTLNDSGNVLQFFGQGNNIAVVENGVTTNYDADLFTAIVVNGGAGADYIRGKGIPMSMIVYGGAGNDTIITSDGDDHVEGGLGNDLINLGAGNDYANGNDENDTLYGGDGDDTLTGGPGRNLMFGEGGDDLLGGGNRPDTMYGGPGNDRMLGRQGGDALFGGDGDDTLDGGDGNDGLLGEDGDDSLLGGRGNDTLRGGRGNDTLRGEGDIDHLYGDAGSDLLDGGAEGDYGYTDGLDILISIEIRRNVK